MVMLYKYNTGGTIFFPLIGSGTAVFSTAASGSLSGTNIQISLDGGAFATSTNTGTVVGLGVYSLVLTTSEMSAKQVTIVIAAGTLGTIVERQAVLIHTFGSASAFYPFDLGTALSAQTVGTVTFVATGTITAVTGIVQADTTLLKGTAIAGTQGTLLVNLVANQAAATIGTVSFVATGTITTITNVASANVVQVLGTAVTGTNGTLVVNAGGLSGTVDANLVNILGTAVVATAGTLTNVGTAGTALGTLNANVVLLLGTAIAGTQGTAIVNLVANQDAVTVGTVTVVLGGTVGTVTGTVVANITQLKGTAIAGTQGTAVVNLVADQSGATIGTVATLTGIASANLIQVKGTAAPGTQGTLDVRVQGAIGTVSTVLTATTALGTMSANVVAINGSATAAARWAQAAFAVVNGTSTGTLDGTGFDTNLTATMDDHFNDRAVVFISGELQFQAARISDYNGTTKRVVTTTMTTAPAAGDVFIIV